jgi:tryptophan-rich sensory protein
LTIYLVALGICVIAAGVESLCAGRDPLAKLKATKQPSWSLPAAVWVLIGIAWYGICFVGLVQLLPFWPVAKLPVALLVALMLANAAANIFQFRMQRLDLAFFYLFPYWILLASFLWAACALDRLTCALFAIYAAYQIYAAFWSYALWRMNPPAR